MQASQTSELLAELAAIDNREVTTLTVEAWHEVIGHLDHTVARRALVKARQNLTIDYVEPKHILAHALQVIADDEREARKLQAPEHGTYPPKPDNFDAMSAVWADPVAFAREVAVYNEQLRTAGFPSTYEQSDRWSL